MNLCTQPPTHPPTQDNPDALVKIGSIPSWIVSASLFFISLYMGKAFEALQVGGWVGGWVGGRMYVLLMYSTTHPPTQQSGEVIGQENPPPLQTGEGTAEGVGGGGEGWVEGGGGEEGSPLGSSLEVRKAPSTHPLNP